MLVGKHGQRRHDCSEEALNIVRARVQGVHERSVGGIQTPTSESSEAVGMLCRERREDVDL